MDESLCRNEDPAGKVRGAWTVCLKAQGWSKEIGCEGTYIDEW